MKRYNQDFLKHKYNGEWAEEQLDKDVRDALDTIYGKMERYYGIVIDEDDYGRLIFNERVVKKLISNMDFIVREAYADAYRDYKMDKTRDK